MRWAEATEERVLRVGMNLREEDKTEVWLSHQATPMEAVMDSWAESDICRCIETDDGVPVGLTGLNGSRIWLLGTAELTATKTRRLQLCKEGRGWVEHCLEVAGMAIGNDVYFKNKASIRWLKHLGFNVAQPRPMGHSAALFCEFWRAA
jgi:hypothetical protein